MIYVKDDYFQPTIFRSLQEYCDNEFQIVKAGEKEFLTLPTPEKLIPILQMEGQELVLSFIRKCHKDFDFKPRIHADNIIQSHKTSMASVLYINREKGVTPNGTSFYEHEKYGHRLPEDVTDEEFDRLIVDDSHDLDKWKKTDYISARPNRMLVYDSQMFHSRFPHKIEGGERIVLVNFYSESAR